MSSPTISASSELTKNSEKSSKQLLLNFLSAAIIVAVILGAFGKTVFKGAPISRVYQLGQRDTLYSKYFTPTREGFDASVYQYFVPSHEFLCRQLLNGQIPLWNPLAGCGAPFLADVETAVAWPLRLMLLGLEPMRSWNLLIVANILNFGLGSFLLAQTLKLRRFAAIFASLLTAFCPFLIFQSELIGSSSSMIPLVMAAFVNAHEKRSYLRRILAGLACAVMIFSGHPEPSFFGIVSSSMLYLCLSVFGDQKEEPAWKRLGLGLWDIAIIGISAFCFSSFMLLPFLELLKNSDCYKLGLEGHRFGVPLNSILINLIHPAYNNSSPFLGILCVPLLLSSVALDFKNNKYARSLLICSAVSIALMSQLGPIDWLMNASAFSWFVPKYCWPSLLIMLSMISAFGLQSLLTLAQKDWRKASMIAISSSLFAVAVLAYIRIFPGSLDCIRQDEAFDHMQVISKFFTRDLILLSVFATAICLSRFFSKAQGIACLLVASICTILSLAPTVKQASPVQANFKYEAVEPIPFLEKEQARILTMGRHVFCPSSNFCFGINNLVPVNVYHPSRFQRFLISCGVTAEGVNQFFDGRLSSAIDAAAVRYIVTPQPVLSKNDKMPEAKALKTEDPGWGTTSQGLCLKAAALRFYPENREVNGTLVFSADSQRAKELAIQSLLTDSRGNILWMSDLDRLVYLYSNQKPGIQSFSKDITIPVPESRESLNIELQVFDWKTSGYLDHNKTTGQKKTVTVAKCKPDSKSLDSELIRDCGVDDSKRRFKLRKETASHIRVYENTDALPAAYLSHDFQKAGSETEAFESVSKTDPKIKTIIESELSEAELRSKLNGSESKSNNVETV
ncbi:MAG: hypothetical protein K2X27_19815, partial [Candidatus Obscuribacterales bacterium]|nr:hypothetical protein [Candidatus Obscuribacterales bacterium]